MKYSILKSFYRGVCVRLEQLDTHLNYYALGGKQFSALNEEFRIRKIDVTVDSKALRYLN